LKMPYPIATPATTTPQLISTMTAIPNFSQPVVPSTTDDEER